jgi:hypothetical protein
MKIQKRSGIEVKSKSEEGVEAGGRHTCDLEVALVS